MFARVGKLLVIATLVISTGAHWAALQTVAWTTMLAANWSGESFSEAVSQTFDGRHLCPLCKAIAAGKQSEQKKEFVSQTLKLEFPPLTHKLVLTAPTPVSAFSLSEFRAGSLIEKPPVPPPRSRFV